MSDEKQNTALHLNCGEFLENLDAYFSGEGEPGFRAHAEKCSSCCALLADFQSIRSAATSLPLESPAPRVWSNVRATLAAEGFFREKESFWEKWIAQLRLSSRTVPLGAAVLVIALTIFMVLPGSLHKKAAPAGSHLVVATVAAPSGLTAVEANLVQTVQQMETSYKAREADLDPVAKQSYERGLTSLDGSIHECLVSLQAQPQNTLARQYLMQAYTEKADILTSALEYDGR